MRYQYDIIIIIQVQRRYSEYGLTKTESFATT